MTTIILTGKAQRDYAKAMIDSAPEGALVTVSDKAAARSAQQNSTLHMWFGEIAGHMRDRSFADVKGECNYKYGVPIRMRDPKFAWLWARATASLNYEQLCAAAGCGTFHVSSGMTVKQLSEYMDAMQRDYRAEGVRLTDPEAMKYE